ncbi:CHAT domain-containing protein [Pseudanabaena biceps]|nr:CHAT domain-containing protein [Pseudanabaena biceps]
MYASPRDMSNSLTSSILLKAKRFGIFSVFAITANILTIPLAAYSQIAVDGSTATEVKGNVISPTGAGTVNGGNLYNSFQEFNVPKSGVIFNTGNSSVDGNRINNIINRVTGENPSSILGTIESRQAYPNANLYLLNPNGVIFSPNARLDIGGSFNVSTGTGLGFNQNQKFTVDKNSLSFPSGDPKNIQFAIAKPAGIINQGNLSVDAGKNIAITAGTVINSGNLSAPSGNISLAAVTGNSQVELRSPDLVLGLSISKDAIPSNWNGAIASLPKLAESLTGKAAEANQVVVKPDGSIALVTVPSSSDIVVKDGMAIASGKIDVSSAVTRGGNVGIFGNQVGLVNAQVNASGSIGGGTVLIGGDLQGKGIAPNALQTYVDASSKILANGLLTGDGGKVIVWADRSTQFLGAIAARGGEISGNGGFVEVSGEENLSYQGDTDTRATNGTTGTLLIDPQNIQVTFGENIPAELAANDQFANPPASATSFISSGTINAATSNVVLQATQDINFNAPINIAASGVGLTAQAGNSIVSDGFGNGTITTNGGNVSFIANDPAFATGIGNITIGGDITTNGGTISLQVNNPTSNANSALTVNANLSSGAGDIKLLGNNISTGGSTENSPDGITINGAKINSSFGNIILNGSSVNGIGINIPIFNSATISSASGTISLTGNSTGAAGGDGVGIVGGTAFFGNEKTIQTNGNIIITGNAVNPASLGINIQPPSGNATLTIDSGTGNLTFTSDRSEFPSVGFGGTGTISLKAFSPNAALTIGGNGVFLSNSFLTSLANSSGFSNVTIGDIAGNNAITVAQNFSINTSNFAPITIQTAGNFNGNGFTIDANSSQFTLTANQGINSLSNIANNNGSIALLANQDITTGNITAAGNAIAITSNLGVIDTTSGLLSSNGGIGKTGGIITLNAGTNVVTAGIDAGGTAGGGLIQISAINIDTTAGTINSVSFPGIAPGPNGNGGDVTLNATGNITTAKVDVGGGGNANNSGNITITSTNGFINTSAGQLIARTGLGNGGDITLQALGNITTNGVWTYVDGTGANGNSGNITLTSQSGSIDNSLGQLLSYNATGNATGNSGNILLNAVNGNISTGNLIDGNTTSTSASSNAGSLNVNALNITNIGSINLSANAGKAGDITLSGNLPLTANTTFLTNSGSINGNINLGNATVTGNQSLILNAGTGNVTLGAIGTVVPLASLDVFSSNTILNADIFTVGGITFDSPVTLANNVAITTSGSPINFNSTINGNQALSLNAADNSIFFNGVVGGFTPLASLTIDPISLLDSFNSIDIKASGNISTGEIGSVFSPVSVDIQTTGSFTPNGSSINSTALNLSANQGVNALGNVFSDGGNINIVSSLGNINSILGTELGTSGLTDSSADSGNISITALNGAINLQNLITTSSAQSPSKAGNITLTVTGNNNISVGDIFASTFGNTTGSAGTVIFSMGTGNINLIGNVIDLTSQSGSSANLTFNNPVVVNSPTIFSDGFTISGLTINTIGNTGSGNVVFNNTVTSPNASNVTINSGLGNVTFSKAIASLTQPLGDLTINSTGTSTFTSLTFANTITHIAGNAIVNGNITATGIQGNGISLFNPTINGNISLTGDEINLLGNATGTGNLVLSPFSVGQEIAISGANDTGNATLDITTTDLSALSGGTLSSLTIGNPVGFGAIDLAGSTTFNQPTTIQSPAGNGTINTSGFGLSNTGGSLTLLANQNITTGNITAAGNAIAITSNTGLINTSTGILDTVSPTANGGAITLQSLGNITTGNIFSFAVNGNGGTISLNTSSGSIDSSLGQLLSNSTIGNGGNILLNAVNGNIGTGTLLNASTNSTSSTSTAGSLSINALNITSIGSINLSAAAGKAGDLTLSGDLPLTTSTTFSTNSGGVSGNINLANANITGNQSLTLNAGTGNVALGVIGTNTTPLTSLDVTSGSTTLNNDIFVVNALTFNSPVILLSGVALNTTNSAIAFNNTVTGNQDLTLNSGANNITFGGTTTVNNLIANSTGTTRFNTVNAASLLTNAGGTTELNGNINSTGAVTFNDAVNLLSAIQFNTSGAIAFNNIVNGNQALSLNAGTNSIFFNGIVGDVTPLASLAIAPTSTLTSNNNIEINTVGNITTGNITNQGRDISLTTTNGTIRATFLSAATISADPSSKAGSITLNTNNLEIGGGIDVSAANGNGSNFDFSGNLLLLADTTISTAGLASSGNINLANANITGNQTLFLNAGNGNIALGAIGSSTNAIAGISFTSSDTILSKDIFINGSLDFRNPVTLTKDVSINSSNIVFKDAVNGSQSLLLNAGTGNITFNGGVGTTTALGNIIANSGGITRFSSNVNAASLTTDEIGTTELNGNVTTSGSQTFNDPVNLTNTVQLDTSNSAIAFNNSVNGTQNITVNSGSADVNFNGTVGDSLPLANLLINSTGLVRFASSVNADSLTISGATLSSNGSITTTGNIATGDISNSSSPLFLTSNNGSITTGNISTTPLNSGNNSGNVTLDANNDINTGNIATDSVSFTGGNILLRSRTGQIVTGNVITSGNIGGSVFFDAATAIVAGAINSSSTTRAGDVTLDPLGDIVVSSIDASSPLQAGNVSLVSTGGGLRITDLINSSSSACIGSSICTSGAIAGNISLQTGGISSFIVGDSSINGSTGTLSTGSTTIQLGTTILVLLGSQFIQGDANSGRISISPGFILAQTSSSSNEDSKFIPPTVSKGIITIDPDESKLLAISEVLKDKVDGYFKEGNLESAFETIEDAYNSELDVFTGRSTKAERARITIENTQDMLSTVVQQTGDAAVLIYPVLLKDRIEILVIPPSEKGNAFRATSSILNQESAQAVITEYRNNLRDVGSNDYLEQSQQLYDWIIRPVEKKLAELKIDTLVFVMDSGLRVTPPSALHDGKKFLIERYAIASIPTLRALRLEERDRKTTRVLAMGLTESIEGFSALPSVDIEIKTISSEGLNGAAFLNQDFTVNNLQKQRQGGAFNILHLGTHAKFVSDSSKDSFIQFWDSRLKLSEIPQLRFDSPAIDMLALSACQTAVGNNLGISGLAVESGAKSVLASLWEVSDAGTAPLMISFYKAFPDAVNKAQAMRTAQLALLGGKVRIGNGHILGIEGFPNIPLPTGLSDIDLSHPFYWSSFILVGNWL